MKCMPRVTFFGLLYEVHAKDYIFYDCFVSILRTLRIMFRSTVILVCSARLGLHFVRLFRWFVTCVKDYISLDCFISI